MAIERGAQFQQPMIPGTEHLSGDINVSGLSRDLRQHEQRTSKSNNSRVHEDAQLSIVMPKHALIKAIDENRFKNTFEVPGAGVGMGSSSYENNRVLAEHEHFGIDLSAPGEKRPIYGMLRDKNDVQPRWWWEDKTPSPAVPEYLRENMNYGDTMADIKSPTKHQSVTTTPMDSLDFRDEVYPKELSKHDSPVASSSGYREVQWHDRPTPRKDIEAVHLKSNLDLHKNRLTDEEIGGQRHREMVGEQFAGAQQTARDLRLSGLRAPVYYWNRDIRYQPTLFEDQGMKGERTEEWRKKQL